MKSSASVQAHIPHQKSSTSYISPEQSSSFAPASWRMAVDHAAVTFLCGNLVEQQDGVGVDDGDSLFLGEENR